MADVGQTIQQIDRVTQDTAASAEECANSSETLENHGEQLAQAVQELLELVQGDATIVTPSVTPPASARASSILRIGRRSVPAEPIGKSF